MSTSGVPVSAAASRIRSAQSSSFAPSFSRPALSKVSRTIGVANSGSAPFARTSPAIRTRFCLNCGCGTATFGLSSFWSLWPNCTTTTSPVVACARIRSHHPSSRKDFVDRPLFA